MTRAATLAAAVLLAAGCGRPPADGPPDTGAKDAARAFFDAVARQDWAAGYAALHADGRTGLRSEAEQVQLFLRGRSGTFTAIIEPKRDTALIGAIVMEHLDLLIDCSKQTLMPRDPDYVVSEIE